MSPTTLVEKIAALPAAEQEKVAAFVESLERPIGDDSSPIDVFDRIRNAMEAAHGKVDISSSIRELRDSV